MIAPRAEGGRDARRKRKRADGLTCQACVAPTALGAADDPASCLAGVRALAGKFREKKKRPRLMGAASCCSMTAVYERCVTIFLDASPSRLLASCFASLRCCS